MFTDEYVSAIEINIPRASFRIFGSDGCIKNIECDNADDFMHVWKITETAKNIDDCKLKLTYWDLRKVFPEERQIVQKSG